MTELIKNILFVEPAEEAVFIPGNEESMIRSYSAKMGRWENMPPATYVGDSFMLEGRGTKRFRRPFKQEICYGVTQAVTMRSVSMRDWINNHILQVETNLRQEVYRQNQHVDTVVVRSGSIVDIFAAGMFAMRSSPYLHFVLEINNPLIDFLKRDYSLIGLETYFTFGSNPPYPDNAGLSEVLNQYLFDEDQEGKARVDLQQQKWAVMAELKDGLGGKVPVGFLKMLAEIIPYYGSVIFASSGHYGAFREIFFPGTEVNIPSPVQIAEMVYLSSKDDRQRNYVDALGRAIEISRQGAKMYEDSDILKFATGDIHYPKFDPNKVKSLLLERGPKTLEGQIVAELCAKDLSKSFVTVSEIKEAVHEIKGRLEQIEKRQ